MGRCRRLADHLWRGHGRPRRAICSLHERGVGRRQPPPYQLAPGITYSMTSLATARRLGGTLSPCAQALAIDRKGEILRLLDRNVGGVASRRILSTMVWLGNS